MNKQEKIKKVMREFKNGTLRSSDGKKVTSRKQALAIAMSESEDYAEKADLISAIHIGSIREAEEILKAAGTEGDLFEKAHKVGDVHPNGKWIWTEYKPGKFDWRGVKKGAKGGGGKTTTTPAPRKASNNGNGKSDFSALDSAQTQKNVNDFWSRILTTDNGHGGINLAGKLLDSMKERGYISLDGGITARGITTYNFKNKDADKNITIVPYQDGLVIKTKDKKETLKVSDFKNVSELKKKFDETILKMAGKKSTTKKSEKPYIYNDGGMVGGKTQIKDEDGLLKVLNGAKSNTVLIYDKNWSGLNSEAKKIGEKNGWKVEVDVDKEGNLSSTGSYIIFKKKTK